RDRESAEGLAEFMITELLRVAGSAHAPAAVAGVRRVCLNLTLLPVTGESGRTPGAGLVFRLYRGIVRLLSRRRHTESAGRLSALFRPLRRPRFLLYERATELPRIALADAMAAGFGTAPRLASPAAVPR